MTPQNCQKIWVKVSPNSPTNKIGLLQKNPKGQEVLKVYLQTIPEKGKANQQLKRFLASYWGISIGNITILQGETSQLKLIEVKGYTLLHL